MSHERSPSPQRGILQSTSSADDSRTRVTPDVPLDTNAFRSPLYAPPTAPRASGTHRAALVIVGAAAALSAALVAAAWALRSSETSVARDPETTPLAHTGTRQPARSAARSAAPVLDARSRVRASRTGAGAQRPAPAPVAQRPAPAPVAAAAAAPSSAPARPAATASPADAKPAAAAAERRKARRTAAERARRSARVRAAERPKLPATLSRDAVISQMRRITPAVRACFGDQHGVAKVTFFVRGKTGRVTTARVRGVTGTAGSCIARAVRRAKFPPFAKSRLEISYPFKR